MLAFEFTINNNFKSQLKRVTVSVVFSAQKLRFTPKIKKLSTFTLSASNPLFKDVYAPFLFFCICSI